MQRLNHVLAAVPVLVGVAVAPAFSTGALPGRWAPPVYLALVPLAVVLGTAGLEEGHPAVPLSALGSLVLGLLWAALLGSFPLPEPAALLAAWRLPGLDTGIPPRWPLLLAAPAAALVLVQTLRGEARLPADEGSRGWLEDVPGRMDLFGLTALGLGVAGTLFAGSTFLEKIAVVAPIFEEYAKLGLALLVLAALGLSSGPSAYATGVLSGLGFGVLEHAVTYSGETQLMFLVRGLFHALAAGLSGLIYVQLRRREIAPGVGWFAIAPAALVHAANNVSAVAVAIARAMRALPEGPISEALGFVFVLTLVGLAIATVTRPARTVETIEAWWHRLNGEIDRPRIVPLRR